MSRLREKLMELLENVVSRKELLCAGEVIVSTAEVADHLIANGVTIQKWVSTSERLPDAELRKAISEGHEYFPCLVFVDNRRAGRKFVTKLWYTGESFMDINMVRYYDADITHWMPLPEPPKEDG